MKYILLFSSVFFWFCSVPDNKAVEIIPETIRMVEKTDSSDITMDEEGIDAIPDGDAIKIEWHLPSDSLDIKKYIIYRSEEASGLFDYVIIYERIINNVFDQENVYEDYSSELYKKYYYYVVSVNNDGNISSPSDTANYRLMEKASLGEMELSNNGIPRITLTFNVNEESKYFNESILRIENSVSNKLIMATYFLADPYGAASQQIVIQGDHLPILLQEGVEYRWRMDIYERDPMQNGSESNWKQLQVNWD